MAERFLLTCYVFTIRASSIHETLYLLLTYFVLMNVYVMLVFFFFNEHYFLKQNLNFDEIPKILYFIDMIAFKGV